MDLVQPLGAQEFATDVRYDQFDSTPPFLKAVKLDLILASTELFGMKAEQLA